MFPNSRINCETQGREKKNRSSLLWPDEAAQVMKSCNHAYLRNFDVICRSYRGLFVAARVKLERRRQNHAQPWRGGTKLITQNGSYTGDLGESACLMWCAAGWGGELTLHVHVWRLVHEMHEELSGVDEDLVPAVADGAIPPGALWQMGRKKWAGQEREVRGTAGTVGGRTTTTGRMTMKASPYTNSTCREKTTSKRWISSKPRHVYHTKWFLN